jgi:hypothetical protein
LAVANAFEPEVAFLSCFCYEGLLQPPGLNHPTQDGVVFGMIKCMSFVTEGLFERKKKRNASAYTLTLFM